MKRIYQVGDQCFETKSAAKDFRGQPTKKAEDKHPAEYAQAIRKGPDHWRVSGVVPGAKPAPAPVKRVRKKKAEAAVEA